MRGRGMTAGGNNREWVMKIITALNTITTPPRSANVRAKSPPEPQPPPSPNTKNPRSSPPVSSITPNTSKNNNNSTRTNKSCVHSCASNKVASNRLTNSSRFSISIRASMSMTRRCMILWLSRRSIWISWGWGSWRGCWCPLRGIWCGRRRWVMVGLWGIGRGCWSWYSIRLRKSSKSWFNSNNNCKHSKTTSTSRSSKSSRKSSQCSTRPPNNSPN